MKAFSLLAAVAMVTGTSTIGCGADTARERPDYSTIVQAITEANCPTVSPNYSGTAGGTGFYGTWSSSWHGSDCAGVVAAVGGLSNKNYIHVGFYDYATYPTNETDCENSIIGTRGMDATCWAGPPCGDLVDDANTDQLSNPTVYVGEWSAGACTFVLYPGYHVLAGHAWTEANYKARTVSAAYRWNGSDWIPQQSYSGVYVF